MSVNKIIGIALTALLAVILLHGCSSKPIDETEPGSAAEAPSGAGAGRTSRAGAYTQADLNDPRSPLYQRTIYFEYDSSDIGSQFIDVLRAHASYLSSNPDAFVTLDGHTDERGTREYNLALGDQRSNRIRQFLLAEGVPTERMRTMSYGEERPADPDHSEYAWALNRRVELVYMR